MKIKTLCEECSRTGKETPAVGLWCYHDSSPHDYLHFLCGPHEKPREENFMFAWRMCDLT